MEVHSGFGLREITGFIESNVEGSTTDDALKLLANLIEGICSDEDGRIKTAGLTVPERDRLLGRVLIDTYGEHVTSTVECRDCDQPFDINFSLSELMTDMNISTETELTVRGLQIETLPDGTFQLPDDRRFRHPTGEDEIILRDIDPVELERCLLDQCQVEGPPIDSNGEMSKVVQEAMAAIAPMLKVDLDASCPECKAKQSVHFDVQHYLLSALAGERQRLAREIHSLAFAYGWSLSEILNLPRSQRRRLVELVESVT